MKICFVVPTLTSGGAERVAVTVLSALDGSKHERVLYLFSDKDAVYRDRLDPAVRVVVAAQTGWVARLLELRRFIRETRPDVVMAFLSYFIAALASWSSGAGPAVVFNQQTPTTEFLGDPDFAWRRPWRRRVFAWMTRLFYSRADAVVVTSKGLADDLATHYGVPRERMHVVHNPVDLEAIARAIDAPVDADVPRPLVVAAGRLAGVKNYPLLIDALAILNHADGANQDGAKAPSLHAAVTRSDGASAPSLNAAVAPSLHAAVTRSDGASAPSLNAAVAPSLHAAVDRSDGASAPSSVHAWILGEGPDHAALEKLASDKGLSGRVRFWGFQSNPWRFMARADVFVLTSAYEGFGNVLIEAMASGAPVVATRSPGTIEILGSGGAGGVLVEHDAASVARAIIQVIADRERLRTEGRAHVRQYDTPRVAARYEQLFEGVAA